eukprot:gene42709-52983_t
MGASSSNAGSPRLSPRISPRASPKVSPRGSPKISPRVSPRLSPRVDGLGRPVSPSDTVAEHVGEMNTPNTPVRVRSVCKTPLTLSKQNGVSLDPATSMADRLSSAEGEVQTPFKHSEAHQAAAPQRSGSFSGSGVLQKQMSTTNTSFELAYNKVAHALRDELLKPSGTPQTHRSTISSIFRRIDENDSGIISVQEMRDFLLSDELGLFDADEDASETERIVNLLMEQLDLNRDGTVTVAELEGFLWPPNASDGDYHELGYVIECTRKAAMRVVSTAAASGSDDAILLEFALLSKTTVRTAHQQDTKVIRKALLNMPIPEFQRKLTEDEVDLLLTCLDGNQDGSVSASEFKNWLFPGIRLREMNGVVEYLQKLIRTHFAGDVKAMYEDFKSHGVSGILKGDFVTKLKAMDRDISRHEANDLAGRIATGGDKVITLARLTDLVGSMGASSSN